MVPLVYNGGFAVLGKKSEGVQVLSARPDDEACRRRIVTGRFFDAPDQHAVVVSEFLAYRLGLVNDADVEGLIGKPLRLEFRTQKPEPGFGVYVTRPPGSVSREERAALDKVTARLPGALEKLGLTKRETEALRTALRRGPAAEPEVFTRGIHGRRRDPQTDGRGTEGALGPLARRFRRAPALPDGDGPLSSAWPGMNDQGVNLAVLLVDAEKDVKDVVDSRRRDWASSRRAALEFIERERLIYVLIFGGMTCVAGVALLVSALGIANTMLMSVLERTREIGIMKAVGADNGHLQFIFLVEGALIGLFGAGIGLLLAWTASFPGDAWVRSMVMRDIKVDLKGAIFVFPPWMAVTVLLFTVLVTTLAALYPARHAARIDPVSASRHE